MSTEQLRTDASSRDRSPDHQYTLSLDQVADLYAQAGLPRTFRAIQKYCAVGKLDAHKVETETGEQWLVASYSVDRHIAYIKEVRTAATSRDQTRTDATGRSLENKSEQIPPTTNEQPRTAANGRDRSASDNRYIERLEGENLFLRTQVEKKASRFPRCLERDKETNTLIHRLQTMLRAAAGGARGPPRFPSRPMVKQSPHQPLNRAVRRYAAVPNP